MDILLFLIPCALLLSGIGLGLFFWAVRQNQFDDLEGPRWKILYEDAPAAPHGTTDAEKPRHPTPRRPPPSGRGDPR